MLVNTRVVVSENIDICQIDYIGIVFPPKLEFSPYSEVIHARAALKLMKG